MTIYAAKNYPSKKAMRLDVEAGVPVRLYSPGLGEPPVNGKTAVSGPWFPEPHKWYAEVTVVDGLVTKVK